MLAEQFDALVAELAAAQGLSEELIVDALQHGAQPGTDAGEDCDTGTNQIEAVLARLYPVELTILATPARTINDLGVKARHAAYVMSHYREAPINQLDWDARTIRLLIEAVCNVTGTQLPFSGIEKRRLTSVRAGPQACKIAGLAQPSGALKLEQASFLCGQRSIIRLWLGHTDQPPPSPRVRRTSERSKKSRPPCRRRSSVVRCRPLMRAKPLSRFR